LAKALEEVPVERQTLSGRTGMHMPVPDSGKALDWDSGSITAANRTKIADDVTPQSPLPGPAKTPGLLVTGAHQEWLFRWLRLFGGARRRTDVDHEAVVGSGFHDDALATWVVDSSDPECAIIDEGINVRLPGSQIHIK
jgi:hypothetical protein